MFVKYNRIMFKVGHGQHHLAKLLTTVSPLRKD